MAGSDGDNLMGRSSPNGATTAAGSLATRVYRRGGAEVLAVSGEVDHATVSEFRAEIDRCLKEAPPVLVLDLSGVSFFGSVGLAALLRAQDSATTVVKVVASNRAVRRPIEATALNQVLSVFPSVDEAVS
jgi:anti-anti-sigma factor